MSDSSKTIDVTLTFVIDPYPKDPKEPKELISIKELVSFSSCYGVCDDKECTEGKMCCTNCSYLGCTETCKCHEISYKKIQDVMLKLEKKLIPDFDQSDYDNICVLAKSRPVVYKVYSLNEEFVMHSQSKMYPRRRLGARILNMYNYSYDLYVLRGCIKSGQVCEPSRKRIELINVYNEADRETYDARLWKHRYYMDMMYGSGGDLSPGARRAWINMYSPEAMNDNSAEQWDNVKPFVSGQY